VSDGGRREKLKDRRDEWALSLGDSKRHVREIEKHNMSV
jgi:hypothetical protein